MATVRDWRNVAVLGTCQMLFNSSRTLIVATYPLIAYGLATNKAFATLPITLLILGTAICSIPASMLMHHLGRRAGFVIGSLIGCCGGLASIAGVYYQDFWWFCIGGLLFGLFAGFAHYYRLAVADVASKEFKGRAISFVIAGGVLAAFLGPELARQGQFLFQSVEFMGSYVFLTLLSVISGLVVLGIDIPNLSKEEAADTGRPLKEILVNPVFIVSCLCATTGQAVMNLLMTATPIAMAHAHHMFSATAFVIQWHVFFMFAPGFITGSLIDRFGPIAIIVAGLVLQLLSILIGISGNDVMIFWAALALLGLGWNFAFTAGTTLLTEVHTPAERAKTQGANNFLIYSTVAVASLLSGTIVHYFGWFWVNIGALPFLVIAFASAYWLQLRRRAERQLQDGLEPTG